MKINQLRENLLDFRLQDVAARRAGKFVQSSKYGACPPGYLQVFDPRSIDSFVDTESDRDVVNRNKALIEALKAKGPYRLLSPMDDAAINRLTLLKNDFENFHQVIDTYLRAAALAKIGNQEMIQKPIILVGPPGCGKSEIVGALALAMNTPVERIQMETQHSGFALTGVDAGYSNSKPGRLFEMLALGDVGNPIIWLDELEKAVGDERFDPIKPLYALLEQTTARSYKDLSFSKVALDASRVQWIATANNIVGIPDPLLSRFRVFNIKQPTPTQLMKIAQTIYSRLLSDLNLKSFDRQLSPDVLDVLSSHGSPRDIRKSIEEGLGMAAWDKRNQLIESDFAGMSKTSTKRTMGFC